MFTLKAYRGPSTFEQTFFSQDVYLDKKEWLIANGFTIDKTDESHALVQVRNELVYGMH